MCANRPVQCRVPIVRSFKTRLNLDEAIELSRNSFVFFHHRFAVDENKGLNPIFRL